MKAISNTGRGQNSEGPLYFRDRYFALDHRHGRYALASALSGEFRSPGLANYDVRNAAFLDIESGPKSEDSESLAFVVGVGRFEPFFFRVRQVFDAAGGTPAGVLTAVRDLLEEASCVVTFNGKTFDLPQLASRFRSARLDNPLEALPHLDLLQSIRRVDGLGLKSRRLADIEGQLLGVQRPDRGPWAAGRLHALLDHNANDVLSLVVLLVHVERRANRLAQHDPRYLLSIGRMRAQEGNQEAALEAFRAAWSLDRSGFVGGESILRLTRMLNAMGLWRESLHLWEEELLASHLQERQIRARLELGQLFEHRLRDARAGLELTRQAMDLIERTSSIRKFEKSYATLAKRALRLEARLARRAARQTS